MLTLANLLERGEEIRRLAERYHTGNVRVFGSVARKQNGAGSDVDILVSANRGCSLFDLGGFLEDLQDMLGCKVDLVIEEGLKARIRDQVIREAIPL